MGFFLEGLLCIRTMLLLVVCFVSVWCVVCILEQLFLHQGVGEFWPVIEALLHFCIVTPLMFKREVSKTTATHTHTYI